MALKLFRLTRDEKTQLHQHVVASGLQPIDFTMSEIDEEYSGYVEFTHKPTDYSFRFSAFEESNDRLHLPSQLVAAGARQSDR